MVASRSRVIRAFCPARFWLSAFCAGLMPTSIGYQDLAALIARGHERAPSSGWHLIASPFGTVEAATFSYSRPIGSAIPEPLGLFQNVNFDPRSLDAYAWKIDEPLTAPSVRQVEYPTVDRSHKGDRLPAASATPAEPDPASLPQLQPISAPATLPVPQRAPAVAPSADKTEQRVDAPDAAPAPAPPATAAMDAHDETASLPPPASGGVAPAAAATADEEIAIADKPPELPAPGESDNNFSPLDELSFMDDDTGNHSTQVYFGGGIMGSPSSLERWAPGAEPILVPPPDSGVRLSALEGGDGDVGSGGIVVGKDNSRLESPADRLGLSGKPRAVAEKCLADAVYFEARGEEYKGQEAVAQVVMNRVFSGYYPHDVCGVVYQNAGRHLACQFTFACEGKDLSRIDEPDMWEQAKEIAKDTLDGKIWLTEVGHATHYHAYWVHPSWVHEMARLYKLGVHTFYRPLNWGDGGDEPIFGAAAIAAANKAEAAAEKAELQRPDPEAISENPIAAPSRSEITGKIPQASAVPVPSADKRAATAKL
jgi:Cell Wall Hydrolase